MVEEDTKREPEKEMTTRGHASLAQGAAVTVRLPRKMMLERRIMSHS